MMTILAEQPYFKVKREIDSSGQRIIKEQRVLQLYNDRIETKHRTFKLSEIRDLSYRRMGGGTEGFLYLHTSRGVFSYHVDEEPKHFFTVYFNLVGD